MFFRDPSGNALEFKSFKVKRTSLLTLKPQLRLSIVIGAPIIDPTRDLITRFTPDKVLEVDHTYLEEWLSAATVDRLLERSVEHRRQVV